jgi:hypothetical protein
MPATRRASLAPILPFPPPTAKRPACRRGLLVAPCAAGAGQAGGQAWQAEGTPMWAASCSAIERTSGFRRGPRRHHACSIILGHAGGRAGRKGTAATAVVHAAWPVQAAQRATARERKRGRGCQNGASGIAPTTRLRLKPSARGSTAAAAKRSVRAAARAVCCWRGRSPQQGASAGGRRCGVPTARKVQTTTERHHRMATRETVRHTVRAFLGKWGVKVARGCAARPG